jgi:hypothetical protein
MKNRPDLIHGKRYWLDPTANAEFVRMDNSGMFGKYPILLFKDVEYNWMNTCHYVTGVGGFRGLIPLPYDQKYKEVKPNVCITFLKSIFIKHSTKSL